VTTCAICDAPFYKDKDVIVVGGGDSAVEEVMQLAPYARTIQLFVRGAALRASFAMQEHLKQVKQVTVHFNSKITRIIGDEHHVRSVEYTQGDVVLKMPIDGVFLAIGHEPNTAIFKDKIACTNNGYIKPALGTQKTSIPGVFVAGDVADDRYRQAGVAAGDGIKAALDAAAFLHEHGYNETYAESVESSFYIPEDVLHQAVSKIETLEELDTLIAQSQVPVLVDFYTPYCPSCMQMLPSIEAVAAQYQDELVVVKVDGSKLKAVMDRWLVATVPHILVFKEGALVARTKEVMNKRELISFVKRFLV
jgi:thioredoxin reductase (NADPH)